MTCKFADVKTRPLTNSQTRKLANSQTRKLAASLHPLTGQQDRLNVVHSPINFRPVDDERGSKSDHIFMRLFAQEAALFERLAETAGLGIEFDPNEETLTSDLFYMVALDAL